MHTKRIIPCLDVKDGRVVKGVNFLGLADVSSPVKLAQFYSENGADELVFYDITASAEGRALFTDVLRRVASEIFIPLTVGGGINTTEDFDRVLKCGADKVSVNSGALRNPSLISEAAKKYGIIPVAGMELTTSEDIHAVCLFENLGDAMRFGEEIEKHRILIKNRIDIFGDQLIMGLPGNDDGVPVDPVAALLGETLPDDGGATKVEDNVRHPGDEGNQCPDTGFVFVHAPLTAAPVKGQTQVRHRGKTLCHLAPDAPDALLGEKLLPDGAAALLKVRFHGFPGYFRNFPADFFCIPASFRFP